MNKKLEYVLIKGYSRKAVPVFKNHKKIVGT